MATSTQDKDRENWFLRYGSGYSTVAEAEDDYAVYLAERAYLRSIMFDGDSSV